MASLVKSRVPKHVIQRFIEMRLTHYGLPGIVVVGQGGEFGTTLSQEYDEFGIDVHTTGSHAGWWQGLVERHGGVVG